MTRAGQRLQNMAQPALPRLQGADPALIAILNRMENKDSTRKKFIMFPKADFDGSSKQAAKSHWLNFQKYVAYQHSQNPRTSKQAQHICELCGNRGHYDYQCQFATDFMQRTQKAFQRSHYMHDTNQDQEWSQGDDHNDQEQPSQ